MKTKYFEVGRPSWSETFIIPVSEENVSSWNWNEEAEEWQEDVNGDFQGFEVWNGSNWELYVDHEMDCDIFNEIQFNILKTDVDFYGTGVDRVLANVDGEDAEYYECSRWQGDIGYKKHIEE